MKKIHDRKLYDTETAKPLARHPKEASEWDDHETLYQTERGNYFIHRIGEPEAFDDPPEKIIPQALEATVDWCARTTNIKAMEAIIGRAEIELPGTLVGPLETDLDLV